MEEVAAAPADVADATTVALVVMTGLRIPKCSSKIDLS